MNLNKPFELVEFSVTELNFLFVVVLDVFFFS